MIDKRKRWLINIVLAVAVISFAGIGVVLPFSGAFQQNRQADPNPATTGAVSSSQQELLEEQARGYELVLQREPDNQTALRGLIDTQIQLGDIEGAIAPMEKLAELNPDQVEYTVLLAQAKQRIGDREGAAQAYRNILESQPGNLYALQGLVDLMVQQDRPEAAIGLLQDTLRTADQANQVQANSVDETSVKLLLGGVYADQERYDEAIALYDDAIESSPEDFRPVLGKALLLQNQGQNEEAQNLFASAAALAPAEYKDQINQLATGETPTLEAPVLPEEGAEPDAGAAPSGEAPAEAE